MELAYDARLNVSSVVAQNSIDPFSKDDYENHEFTVTSSGNSALSIKEMYHYLSMFDEEIVDEWWRMIWRLNVSEIVDD